MKNTTGISGGGSRVRQRPVPSSSNTTDTQALGCDILNAGKINYLLPDDLCAVSSDSALLIGWISPFFILEVVELWIWTFILFICCWCLQLIWHFQWNRGLKYGFFTSIEKTGGKRRCLTFRKWWWSTSEVGIL